MNNLVTVTDRFSVIDNIRKHTPQNARNYVLSSVKASLESKEVKERMALGELYGFYGHSRREEYYKRTGELRLPETSFIMIDGKPVALDNVPSNRTVAVSIDDSGIVSHSQEILDTDTGRIVKGMEHSRAGGWSWVTGGSDSPWKSVVRRFYGFDYVTTPNYISLDRELMMAESVSDRQSHIVQAFVSSGFTESAAIDLSDHFEKMREHDMMIESVNRAQTAEGELLVLSGHLLELNQKIEVQDAMLGAVQRKADLRQRYLRSAIDKLPVFLSEEQKNALLSMETEDDLQMVEAIFESVGNVDFGGLPLGRMSDYQPAPHKRSSKSLSQAPIFSLKTQKPPKFG
ncbi:head processing protein [Xenorhabdus sp. XENO-1]|uniref:head processing protein n=1 Tax=Xenorhabdus bovienii TaxID=40576 RepID=UPI0020CA94A0|nr:head processing protein [Xenorhabdus bovienii]MCP9269512.1 head processing protein [Xenorhabdus bovienii subsp. africana]